jgi:signal transduction histidine kinase
MKMLAAGERPADRSAVRWAFDTLVTLVAAALAVSTLFRDNAHPSAGAIVAVIGMALPLVVRRAWPVHVFGWLVLASIIGSLWGGHLIPGPALLVALFTIAATRSRRDALVAAAVLEVIVVVTLIRLAGGSWWFDAIFVSGLVAAAVALGLYAGTRRAYLIELHDRAERLERERDQQGVLAAAAERARIAREMHDIVAHHLTVMVSLSDGAIAASAKEPDRAIDVMRSVSATGRRALADTRRLLGVLRDGAGEESRDTRHPIPDLGELDTLIEGVRDAGLPTTLEVDGPAAEIPADVQLTVYRIVQEALTNTLKHGGSGVHAVVRLHYSTDELRVEVDDDGAGTHAPSPVTVGGGLIGMRERVHASGGDIRSGPLQAGGWRVSARLRLDDGRDT